MSKKTVAKFGRGDSLFIERCLKDYKELLRMVGNNKPVSERIDLILKRFKVRFRICNRKWNKRCSYWM